MVETGRQPLSRRRILEAAVRLVDREGLAALSMRKLGQELGVEAMSLYRYVPNKAALLDGIAETVVGEAEIPPADAGDWAERARAMNRAYRRLAHAHPNVFPLIALRPLNTPAALRPIEAALELFCGAGFDEQTALHAFRTLASYASGYALEEIRALSADDADEDARLDIRRLPAEEFPRLVALAPYRYRWDEEEYEFGLEVILTGLRAKLEQQRAPATEEGAAPD